MSSSRRLGLSDPGTGAGPAWDLDVCAVCAVCASMLPAYAAVNMTQRFADALNFATIWEGIAESVAGPVAGSLADDLGADIDQTGDVLEG